jgi:hypothetical protein
MHQRGSRDMRLQAHTEMLYYFKIAIPEGAWVFDAIPVLSSVECELVRQTVHALRSSWIARGSADYPFYTVGAASYIDAVPGTTPPRYSEILVETNPVLREHFDWLYARVMNKLSVHLQVEVRTADELALPGFHVWKGLSVPTYHEDAHRSRRCHRAPVRAADPGGAGHRRLGAGRGRSRADPHCVARPARLESARDDERGRIDHRARRGRRADRRAGRHRAHRRSRARSGAAPPRSNRENTQGGRYQ